MNNNDATNRPIYWFTTLDIALERGDFALAAEAQQRLRRLGIELRLHLDRQSAALQKQDEPGNVPQPKDIDLPAYWLVSLESAFAEGDNQKMAVAQVQLRRLGIDVTLRRIS